MDKIENDITHLEIDYFYHPNNFAIKVPINKLPLNLKYLKIVCIKGQNQIIFDNNLILPRNLIYFKIVGGGICTPNMLKKFRNLPNLKYFNSYDYKTFFK